MARLKCFWIGLRGEVIVCSKSYQFFGHLFFWMEHSAQILSQSLLMNDGAQQAYI